LPRVRLSGVRLPGRLLLGAGETGRGPKAVNVC
jgi:hypothetical protein